MTISAPLAPVLLTPVDGGVIFSLEGTEFTWAFRAVGSPAAQSGADFRYKVFGAALWTTITNAATTNTNYVLPAGTWPPGDPATTISQYEWQGKTRRTGAADSPWSSSFFTTSINYLPAPAITCPVTGTSLPSYPPTTAADAFLARVAAGIDGATVTVNGTSSTVDNLATVQAAVDTLKDLGTIGKLVLTGLHAWSGSLRMPGGIGATGASGGGLVIDGTGLTAPIVNLGTSVNMMINSYAAESFPLYTGRGNILILNVKLDHNGYNGTVGTQTGINDAIAFGHARACIVQGTTVYNTGSGHAIEFNSVDGGLMEHCELLGFTYTGNPSRSTSESVQIDMATSGGWVVMPQDDTAARNITIRYNHFAGNSTRSGLFGKAIGSHAYVSPPGFEGIAVYGNTSDGVNDIGITAYHWSTSMIRDNILVGGIYGISSQYSPDIVIAGNTLTEASLAEVWVDVGSDGAQVDTNSMSAVSTTPYGVLVQPGVTGVALNGNTTLLPDSLQLDTTVNSSSQITAPALFSWTVLDAFLSDSAEVRRSSASNGGGTLYYDSPVLIGQTTRIPLDAVTRTDFLAVRYSHDGHWSPWAWVSLQVALSPPTIPLVTAVVLASEAAVQMSITNPLGVPGYGDAVSNDVYRDGVRIATGLPVNEAYIDWFPGAGEISYTVTAFTVNGASASNDYTPPPGVDMATTATNESATVTSVSPLRVQLDSTSTDAPALTLVSYIPVVGNRVTVLVQGSQLLILGAWAVTSGQLDTGWVTSGFTAAAGFTITSQNVRRRNGIVTVNIGVTTTNILAAGNIANTPIVNIPAGWVPAQSNGQIGGGPTSGGHTSYASTSDGGTIIMTATDVGFGAGTGLYLIGMWML